MKKIIGVGNALVDILVQVDTEKLLAELGLPKGSMQFTTPEQQIQVETFLASADTIVAAGGSTSNAMKTAAMLGMETAFIGKVGMDEKGKLFEKALRQQHVRPLLVKMAGQPTGIASTFITPDGQRTFADHLGASALLAPADLSPEMLDGYDTLYMEGYMVQSHDLITTVLAWAKEKGMTICMDLASYNVVSEERDFFYNIIEQYLDIVFANEEESMALTRMDAAEAVKEIKRLCNIAVVKLGEKGACAYAGAENYFAQGVHVDNVVDTTGAGDSFAGGFLYALSKGKNLEACLAAGNMVAAETIQQIGATMPESKWITIKERLCD